MLKNCNSSFPKKKNAIFRIVARKISIRPYWNLPRTTAFKPWQYIRNHNKKKGYFYLEIRKIFVGLPYQTMYCHVRKFLVRLGYCAK